MRKGHGRPAFDARQDYYVSVGVPLIYGGKAYKEGAKFDAVDLKDPLQVRRLRLLYESRRLEMRVTFKGAAKLTAPKPLVKTTDAKFVEHIPEQVAAKMDTADPDAPMLRGHNQGPTLVKKRVRLA